MDSHPQRELSGPKLPFPVTGTVISAENQAMMEPSTGLIEPTNTAPSRTADWGMMASPMGPFAVESDTRCQGGSQSPRSGSTCLLKRVCRTSPCHSASSTAYTRFHHPLSGDSHRP